MGRRIASVAGLVIAVPVIAWAGAATPAAADMLACDGQWSVVPTSDHSQQSGEIDSLNSVAALRSTDEWAVGSWLHYPDAYVFHTLVEHWDGSSAGWTIVPSPNAPALNSYFNGIAADAPDDVWAVGGTDQSGPPYRSLLAVRGAAARDRCSRPATNLGRRSALRKDEPLRGYDIDDALQRKRLVAGPKPQPAERKQQRPELADLGKRGGGRRRVGSGP